MISIPKVTGDIVITATAVESASTIVDVPLEWNEGYSCKYDVGAVLELKAENGYCCSQVIDVVPGMTYTVEISDNTATESSFKFVGGSDDNLVTEVVNCLLNITKGTFIFTPSASTTKLILRTYSKVPEKGTWKLSYDSSEWGR